MWDCVCSKLVQRCYEGCMTETADKGYDMMKKMSIRDTNKLCNVVHFLSMGQVKGETVTSYIARVKGQSKTCTLPSLAQLSAEGWQHKTSYSEEMLSQQLICELLDTGIQESPCSECHRD